MRRRPTRRHGFTLVEVLVSSVILSLGFVAVSQLYLASVWTYQKAHNTAVATKRAHTELDQAITYGYAKLAVDDLSSTYTTGYTKVTSSKVRFSVSDLPEGRGTLEVVKSPNVPGTNDHLLGVIVDITWGGSVRGQSRVRVNTFISEKL